MASLELVWQVEDFETGDVVTPDEAVLDGMKSMV